ncbi:MAG: putative aminohydrolase SsnA [bacterium]|nr:putative aminohydrolase SsnA [bacterium]
MFLLTNGLLLTFDSRNRVIDNGAIAIDGSLIKDIGATAAIKRKYPTAKGYDVNGALVLPGMINVHTHLYSAFACGMPVSGSPTNFVQILKRIWWKLDCALTEEDIYYSALVTGIEAIKSGTTTIFDHHSSPRAVPNSLEHIARALLQLGLRANLCYEVSDRDGNRIAQQGLQENLRWITNNCSVQHNPLLSASFGLHASFTLSESTLRQAAELGNSLNSGFHIHLAEDTVDQVITKKKYRKSVVHRLADLGILGKKTIAAHGIYLSASEIDILKQTDTIIVHNPGSNMNNAVGVAPVIEMLKRNILVGLGTDGLGNDMITELRLAGLLHKLAQHDPRVFSPELALKLAIENNRKITARFFAVPVGMLTPDAAADIIVIKQYPAINLSAKNIGSYVVYGMRPVPIDTVYIAGKKVLEHGKICGIDEQKVYQQARERAKRVWSRLLQ